MITHTPHPTQPNPTPVLAGLEHNLNLLTPIKSKYSLILLGRFLILVRYFKLHISKLFSKHF